MSIQIGKKPNCDTRNKCWKQYYNSTSRVRGSWDYLCCCCLFCSYSVVVFVFCCFSSCCFSFCCISCSYSVVFCLLCCCSCCFSSFFSSCCCLSCSYSCCFSCFFWFVVDFKRRSCPFLRCASVANGIGSDIDIFNGFSLSVHDCLVSDRRWFRYKATNIAC